MNIRAKMRCAAIERSGESERVTLYPVYSADPNSENAQWAKWTPAGDLHLTIDNPSAQGAFIKEQEYFIDITPAS